MWLSLRQVAILTVNDRAIEYANGMLFIAPTALPLTLS